MKPRTIVLMVIAVVCGLVASYLTSRMLAQQGGGPEEEKVKILVAKQKISMGTKIKDPEKFFVEKEFVKGTEPKKAITAFEQLKDKSLNKTLNAEVHVTADDLMTKEQEGLATDIPPGMRAVTITVRSDTDVAGFILPHSRVDVIHVTRTDTGPLSRIILQDVLVLAKDTIHVRDDKNALPSATCTLLLKPDDAERIALAASMGDLRLVLRSADDHEAVHTKGVSPGDVIHASSTGSSSNGNGGDDVASSGGGGGALPGNIPDAPGAAKAPVAVAKVEPEPVILAAHTLTIYNGEVPTKAVFVLNDKNTEVQTRIERTPLEGLPPRDEKKTEAPAKPEKESSEGSAKKDGSHRPAK